MPQCSRHWMSSHHIFLLGTRLFAVLGAVFAPLAVEVFAEPITFRFDGVITHSFAAKPFELPFRYKVGDVISGKFTFDPSIGIPFGDNALDSEQPYPLEFKIDGTFIGSSQYGMRVVNHNSVPGSIEDLDGITLACSPSSLQECMPAVISFPGSEPFSITSRMHLAGDGSILSEPLLSPELSTWNSFTLERSLAITFDAANGGSMLLLADIGSFAAVPEPTTLCAMACMSAGLLLRAREKRKGHRGPDQR